MVETTEQYHRIPVGKKKKNAKIRTITISKGIKALYDVTNKAIVTYLFSVKQYTMKEAKQWVKRHKDNAALLQAAQNLSLVEDISELYENSKKLVLENFE
jgi:hypothetical protein